MVIRIGSFLLSALALAAFCVNAPIESGMAWSGRCGEYGLKLSNFQMRQEELRKANALFWKLSHTTSKATKSRTSTFLLPGRT